MCKQICGGKTLPVVCVPIIQAFLGATGWPLDEMFVHLFSRALEFNFRPYDRIAVLLEGQWHEGIVTESACMRMDVYGNR